jgi:hypothetical protein
MAVFSCAICKKLISSAAPGGKLPPELSPATWAKGRWSCPDCRMSFCDTCVPPTRPVCPLCKPPDLSVPPRAEAFGRKGPSNVLDALAERAGALVSTPPRKFSTFDYGRQRDPSARSILVNRADAATLVYRMRQVLPDGVVIFVGASRWPGEGQKEDQVEVVIANASSQFDVPLIARTLGTDSSTGSGAGPGPGQGATSRYGLKTADLVARLQQFHKMYGIEFFQAESDAVLFKLKKLPSALKVFCADLREMCPEAAEGEGGLEALAKSIREAAGVVALRWNRGAPLDAVAGLAARLVGAPVRSYSTHEFGAVRDESARSMLVDAKEASRWVAAVREVLPAGFIAFAGTTRWLGSEPNDGKAELVIARGESQLDCIRVARTEPVNYGISTEDVVAKLREYDEKYGVDIDEAETDSIGFRLLRPPPSLEAFSADLMEFCPDLRDHFADEKDLAEKLAASRHGVILWWD